MIDLDRIPLLAPSLTLERLGEDGAVLLGDREHVLLGERSLVEVAYLVDGRRTKSELLEAAGRKVGDLQALAAVHQLEQSGRLVTAPRGAVREETAFWHALGAELPEALERLQDARIRVEVTGRHDPVTVAELCQALRDAGLQPASDVEVSPSASPAQRAGREVEVRLVGDYLDPELDGVNRRKLQAGTWWCPTHPLGAVGWVGPLFGPGPGPCWACLAHRLRSNQPVQAYLRERREGSDPRGAPRAYLKASRRLLLDLTALAVAQAVANPEASPLRDHLLTFDFKTLEVRRHFVARRSQCPVCGDPELIRARASRPVELAETPKSWPHQGGYRQQQARGAFERHRRLVSPYTGVATFLEPMPGRDPESQAVYVSGYPVPPLDDAEMSSCLRLCAGKGRSHEQARMSALSEVVERRSGQHDGDEPRVRGSLAELGDRALPPALLHGFSARQVAERSRSNAAARDRSQWVPEPLDPHTAIDWTPAWSLGTRERRLVPFTYCYAGAPAETGGAYCAPNGNGVAAGASLEEAILQALLELVERDAVAIWWYNALVRPRFDLSRVRDPYLERTLAHHRRQGAEVWALDLTHDLELPVCAAIRRDPQGCFSVGFGSHLDPELAAQRAFTELDQLGDGKHPGTGKPLLDTARLPDRRFLFPAESSGALRAHAGFDGPHLAADIEECQRRLHARGLEVLVIDKTRPDFELHVAQVIVPGLRHFWPRFAPGRLYDVPVELGWLARAKDEGALNPVALLL